MPSKADDRWFGNKPDGSRKAYEEMVKTYGLRKAVSVYEATKRRNQRKAKRGR